MELICKKILAHVNICIANVLQKLINNYTSSSKT